MAKRKSYIINLRKKIIHKRNGLTENCNTDQIREKVVADTIGLRFFDFRRCKYCHG